MTDDATRLRIKGAAALGVKPDITDDDLVYDAKREVAPRLLEKIAAHEEEIVATLKTRRAAIVEILEQVRDLDPEQLAAFRNAKVEEIEILQAALAGLDGASAPIVPAMKANGLTWGRPLSAFSIKMPAMPSTGRRAMRLNNGSTPSSRRAPLDTNPA